MEKNWLERTELLIKEKGARKLLKSNVLVIGLGGVGSAAAEFLARAGLGAMTVVDAELVDITTLHRELPALHRTRGLYKADLMQVRVMDFTPKLTSTRISLFLAPVAMLEILGADSLDYVLDCKDSVT